MSVLSSLESHDYSDYSDEDIESVYPDSNREDSLESEDWGLLTIFCWLDLTDTIDCELDIEELLDSDPSWWDCFFLKLEEVSDPMRKLFNISFALVPFLFWVYMLLSFLDSS